MSQEEPIRPQDKKEGSLDTSDAEDGGQKKGGVDERNGMELQGEGSEEIRCSPCEEKAETVAKVRTPGTPTKQEVEDHELTHCPPRIWCDHCVRGQSKDDQHRSISKEMEESTVPRVSMDYCFLKEDKKK